jgi:hypothetical protein
LFYMLLYKGDRPVAPTNPNIMGTSKNSPDDLFLSFPRKRESIKINNMDSPIKSGNDKKMNN